MMEKHPENTVAQKIRAILSLEVDVNAIQKIIFNGMLMPRLEEETLIPREIIGGRRTQKETHLALNEKLISDVANVKKLPSVTTHAGATNYFNRVAYPFESLCVQHFRLDAMCTLFLFETM